LYRCIEGIALVGNPEFALVDEAYPYISKRLLTDDSPRLRESLKYMVGFVQLLNAVDLQCLKRAWFGDS
jgi:hypothetical protein